MACEIQKAPSRCMDPAVPRAGPAFRLFCLGRWYIPFLCLSQFELGLCCLHWFHWNGSSRLEHPAIRQNASWHVWKTHILCLWFAGSFRQVPLLSRFSAVRSGHCDKWPPRLQYPGRQCFEEDRAWRGSESIPLFGVTEGKLRASFEFWLYYYCVTMDKLSTSLSLILFNCNMKIFRLPNERNCYTSLLFLISRCHLSPKLKGICFSTGNRSTGKAIQLPSLSCHLFLLMEGKATSLTGGNGASRQSLSHVTLPAKWVSTALTCCPVLCVFKCVSHVLQGPMGWTLEQGHSRHFRCPFSSFSTREGAGVNQVSLHCRSGHL